MIICFVKQENKGEVGSPRKDLLYVRRLVSNLRIYLSTTTDVEVFGGYVSTMGMITLELSLVSLFSTSFKSLFKWRYEKLGNSGYSVH